MRVRAIEPAPGTVDAARTPKPAIPATGASGIPRRDEIDLQREV
jgi:hypothetical protein